MELSVLLGNVSVAVAILIGAGALLLSLVPATLAASPVVGPSKSWSLGRN